MEAAVPTFDSNSPLYMSSWQILMMVDVYVAISVEAGISNWGGRTASRVALWTCLAMMFSILVSSTAWLKCSTAIVIPTREATCSVAFSVW